MEIIKTVPVSAAPSWLMIMCIIGALGFFVGILTDRSSTLFAPIVGTIGALILIVGLVLGMTDAVNVYDHDEYIVKLNDTSAVDFINEYELVKTFKYSDVIQVKRRNNK